MTTPPARYIRPTVPKGTGPAGRRFLRAVIAGEWEFRPDELPLLLEAGRVLDELAAMRQRVEDDGIMTLGSTGQQRAHPLLAEIRGSRQVLARLLSQLGIPDDEQPVGRTARQARASKAARVRWGHGTNDGQA